MKLHYLLLGAAIAVSGTACAADPSKGTSNLLVDPAAKNKTVWPKPVADSGTLKYNDHRQDLSRWPSLSYADTMPTREMKRVELNGELKGDPKRGKEIALNKSKGNCWSCHTLPGDPQGGTAGPSLLGFGTRGYSDAHVYQQIFDARAYNGLTVMPPYGTNEVLADQDIRDLVAFLQSIK
jgi:sulfur-oxidizing protein SoxX